ncbi:MAG TPA: SDR family oxidoreductase [Stellaceae bacterium]|jgi:3-oxoacyl-[acyl-carrier protein] reductase|nr:SDR family oxidoreductase [Stellaceae bacterium]
MPDDHGRNVIVTGGSRGLGLGIGCRLAEAGFRVIAIARKPSDELLATERSMHFWPCDLGAVEAIPGLVKAIAREFGPIYGLVNNAGIGTSGVLANMRAGDIERTVRLNTVSPMMLTKHVTRTMMVAGQGGRIVNISSIVSTTGFSGLSVYAATKASLIGFTKSLAREVGPLGITVNAVAPGFVDTAMTEGLDGGQREQIARRSALKRLAEIDDVANAVGFLMSDPARNITGTVLTVDAGGTA